MKTVAIRFARNLIRVVRNYSHSVTMIVHSRDNEENKSVSENKLHEPTSPSRAGDFCRARQLVYIQAQDDEVETHRIDEDCCQNLIIRFGDLTPNAVDPGRS